MGLHELLHGYLNLLFTFLADCLESVGASTSQNPMGLHELLHGYLNILFTFLAELQVVCMCAVSEITSEFPTVAKCATDYLQ
jgi:hypothetical protein